MSGNLLARDTLAGQGAQAAGAAGVGVHGGRGTGKAILKAFLTACSHALGVSITHGAAADRPIPAPRVPLQL
jgi:hypothetical protein